MVVSRVTRGEPLIARADDGAELALWRAFRTAGQIPLRHVPIILVHGTFSDRHFFGGRHGFAQYLADRGYDAWVAELRGRRTSLGKGSNGGFEDWIVRDAPALLRALREATGSAQVLWIGHSAGAVVGVGCAARGEELAGMFAGLVAIAAPMPHSPGVVHVAATALGHLIGSALGRFPARALRIGPVDEHPGVLKDWLRWNTGGWVGADGFDYLAEAKRFRAPAMAVAGAADVFASPRACRRLMDALGTPGPGMMVCGRAEGFSRNYTHNRLVVSSAARQEVWPLIAHWIDERFA